MKGERVASLLLAGAALGVTLPSHALTFNFSFATGTSLKAQTGFQAAASILQKTFADPVTVDINAAFTTLGSGILGSARSASAAYEFTNVKTRLSNDQTSADDAIKIGSMPGDLTYSKYINQTTTDTAPHVHSGVEWVRLTSANAKALGITPTGTLNEFDAAITFSDAYIWDFDRSNGITPESFDFVGVAMHELIHAMGFVSGVDVLDINAPNYPDDAYDSFASLLDFTRHSEASRSAGADMDWTVDDRQKLYSIDAGATAILENGWSHGASTSDGRQASHWKDRLGIGLMDPTIGSGSLSAFTFYDEQALDVIGWDRTAVVPIPASVLLMGSALGLFGLVRRRKLS